METPVFVYSNKLNIIMHKKKYEICSLQNLDLEMQQINSKTSCLGLLKNQDL